MISQELKKILLPKIIIIEARYAELLQGIVVIF